MFTSSSTRSLIGASALVAAAALFSPPGKTQTLADLGDDVQAQRLAAMAVCDSIRDDAERVGCRGQKSYDFDIARAEAARKQAAEARKQAAEARKAIAKSDAAIAEHRTEAQCLRTLSEAITGKRVPPADVRAAFKTPTETTNACEVVRRLHPRLSELTKQ